MNLARLLERTKGVSYAMSHSVLFGPPSATLVILLDDDAEHDFASAEHLLSGLTGEQATSVPAGLPYSIAAILAHMNSNLRFNLDLIFSPEPETYENPYESWPAVTAEDWPKLVGDFLEGLAEMKRMTHKGTDLERVLYPATEEEPAWTVGYKLALSVAKHNAYHFGQIALLRRLIGA